MVIRERFKELIDRLPEGEVVSAADFDIPRRYRATLVKALNQFERAGFLKRACKGRYYKPAQSAFGNLPPSEYEIIKDLLVRGGNRVGYITGTRAFEDLALTTQVSAVITIGTNVPRRPVTRGQSRITFLLQPNPITKDDIPLFVILDALRLIKEIPAAAPYDSIPQIVARIGLMSDAEKYRLVELGKAYRPYVRAQLGAIIEYLGFSANELLESLNPVSYYKLGIPPTVLPTSRKWNIL